MMHLTMKSYTITSRRNSNIILSRNLFYNNKDMETNRRIKIAAAMQRMVYVVFALFIVLFIIALTK